MHIKHVNAQQETPPAKASLCVLESDDVAGTEQDIDGLTKAVNETQVLTPASLTKSKLLQTESHSFGSPANDCLEAVYYSPNQGTIRVEQMRQTVESLRK